MPNPTTYTRAKTLQEALELAQQPSSIIVAGGALTFNMLDVPYTHVIDVQDIAELKRIEGDDAWLIGGAVTLQQVADLTVLHPVVRRALMRCVPLNVRHNTSVLESLRYFDVPMLREWWSVLAVLDVPMQWVALNGAVVPHNMSGLLAAHQRGTTLPGVLHDLTLTLSVKSHVGLGSAFVARTPQDEPIVNAAAYVQVNAQGYSDICWIAVGGMEEKPIEMVTTSLGDGETLFTAENIVAAMQEVPSLVHPVTDWRGTADYKREMARVCAQRALMECLAQVHKPGGG
jgi:CO/xanthine dehydrogenase FAD-binding subunit